MRGWKAWISDKIKYCEWVNEWMKEWMIDWSNGKILLKETDRYCDDDDDDGNNNNNK